MAGLVLQTGLPTLLVEDTLVAVVAPPTPDPEDSEPDFLPTGEGATGLTARS